LIPELWVLLGKYWTGIPADGPLYKRWGMDFRQPQGKPFKEQRQILRILGSMLMNLLWPNPFGPAGTELVYGLWPVEPKD
jgi:hypothetical protein